MNFGNQQDIANGIRVVSFFSGAGGLDLGFDQAGYDIVYTSDIEQKCCDTLRTNAGTLWGGNPIVVQADIREIELESLPKNIDLVIGGPPCQSFSASGRRAGGAPGRLDERGSLFEAYCRIIEHLQPKAFVFENVRGILGTNKGADWKSIIEAFQQIGYNLSYRILDALDYGAPQQRERLFMVGHRLGTDFLFPRPLYGPDSLTNQKHITAGMALEGLNDDLEDKKDLLLANGKYAHLLPLVPPGDNYLYFTAKRGYPEPIFAYRSRFSDFLYKANPDTPIKTLIARPGKYTGPFHWDNRSFTVREYMRLQGFPDDYKFVGDRIDQIRQIGNSVSPHIAFQLALAIAKQVFQRDVAVELMPPDFVLSFDERKSRKAARTRQVHLAVAKESVNSRAPLFKFENYKSDVTPTDTPTDNSNVTVITSGNTAYIKVHADDSEIPFVSMQIEVFQPLGPLFTDQEMIDATLIVDAFGNAPHTVQTMWNAVDDWVIRSSNFHSLFELYGHFTEPHPIFRISQFNVNTDSPIAAFARHIANFENCSTYFPKEHLTKLFGNRFGTDDFIGLVKMLRSFRFDIRCHETNITIPQDVYMVSYPFTLPFGKQMNFSIKPQRVRGERRYNMEPKN